MARPVHFEIHVDDPARAMAFYEQALGWRFHRFGAHEYWLAVTGPEGEPGINGGLIRRKGQQSGDKVIAYVCTMQVADLDRSIAAVTAAGGTVAVARHAVPGVGWSAYAKDTEGNAFGLHQPDQAAA